MLGLVSELSPDVLFLDFDRTVASTRNGNNPLNGVHSVDVDLLGLIAEHGTAHIVTRNRHTEEICEFLARAGVPDATVPPSYVCSRALCSSHRCIMLERRFPNLIQSPGFFKKERLLSL